MLSLISNASPSAFVRNPPHCDALGRQPYFAQISRGHPRRAKCVRNLLCRRQCAVFEASYRGLCSLRSGSASTNGPDAAEKQIERPRSRTKTSAITSTDADYVGSDFQEKSEHSGMAILNLALPTLGIVLADPLMSVIDTGCVGQLSSIQLAALGPNTLIFNFVLQALTFLGTTTCNFMATTSVSTASTPEEERDLQLTVSRTLSQALCLAAILGILIMGLMELSGHHLLLMMGAGPDYIDPALTYLRIRAVSVPAALMLLVGQGACLGWQDTKTPLVINSVAASFNLVGDLVFALWLAWGVTGAAWMTVFSQYLALFLLLKALKSKSQQTRAGPLELDTKNFSSRALKPAGIEIGWFGFPSWAILEPYYNMGISLIPKSIFGMMVYTSIGKVAASVGTLSIAAHQVAMQVFWFLSYFAESLAVSAQSLVARDVKHNRKRARTMARLLLRWALVAGFTISCAVAIIHLFCTSWLTSDENVATLVISITKQSMLCVILCAVASTIESISIASGDVAYLARMQLLICSGMLFALLATYKAGWGLPGIWWIFVLFFGGRIVYHIFHITSHWEDHILGGYPQSDVVC